MVQNFGILSVAKIEALRIEYTIKELPERNTEANSDGVSEIGKGSRELGRRRIIRKRKK